MKIINKYNIFYILYIMFASLLDNLGIATNTNTNTNVQDSNLIQGQDFIKYERAVKAKTFVYLPFLELTSMPGLTSINEAFTGGDSLHSKSTDVKNDVSENESAFNKTLSEYSTLQKEYDSTSMNGKKKSSRDNELIRNLEELKFKLIDYAKKINIDMSNLQVDDNSLKKYVVEQQDKLNKYIQKLSSVQRSDEVTTPNGMLENSKLIRTSTHYHYLMWFIVLLTFLSLFMYILTSDLIMNTLVVIICLMVIYILAKAINNNYM